MLAYRAFDFMRDAAYSDAIYNRLHGITIPCTCLANHDAAMNHIHDPIVHANATIYESLNVRKIDLDSIRVYVSVPASAREIEAFPETSSRKPLP
jgi:hypothetical protein